MPIPEEAASRIRLVVLDVDGVLTDGALYIGATEGGDRVELKRFDVQDGLGIKMMRKAGIEVAIVSGRVSAATDLRARELGPGRTVVTVICDSGLRYLNGDLYRNA